MLPSEASQAAANTRCGVLSAQVLASGLPWLPVPCQRPGRLAHSNVPPEISQQGPDPALCGQGGSSFASLLFCQGPCLSQDQQRLV